jgi:hypothetical protein
LARRALGLSALLLLVLLPVRARAQTRAGTPSLEETLSWIESQTLSSHAPGGTLVEEASTAISHAGCNVRVTHTHKMSGTVTSVVYEILLAQMDTAMVFPPEPTGAPTVALVARAASIKSTNTTAEGAVSFQKTATIGYWEADLARRVAKAALHAIRLCKAQAPF